MRSTLRWLLSLSLFSFTAVPALAIHPYGRASLPDTVAFSEVIAVGRVDAVGEPYEKVDANGWKTVLRIARVRVVEDLRGAAGATELKVTFVPAEHQGNVPTPVLVPGQELCLFLGRNEPGGDVFHLWGPGIGRPATVPGGSEDVEGTAAEARRLIRLLADPRASLTSKDPDERMLTAWMLAVRYRRFPTPPQRPAEEPLADAEESRLILEGLVRLADRNQTAFWDIFESLNLQLGDGWDPDFQSWHGIHEKAQAWVRDHASTWRFRRRVAAPPPGRRPPASPPPVALFPRRDTSHWELAFNLADRDAVDEIRFRMAPDGEWMKTRPNRSATVPPAWIRPGRHQVEVELVDRAGNVSGPYLLAFDPEEEVLRWAKYDLRRTAYSWIELDDREYLTRYLLFFSDLLDVRDVLREIRYSLDDCSLDRRFPFEPWTDLQHDPGDVEPDYVEVPKTLASACVQLVFRDGEITEPRRFWFRRPEPRPVAEVAVPEPPASPGPITLLTSRSNSGWELIFQVDRWQTLREIRYRLGEDREWTSTGDYPVLSPHTGLPRPETGVPMDPLRISPGRLRVEVQLLDPAGEVSGPYTLWFDPLAEVISEAKLLLSDLPWADFDDVESGNETLLSFRMLDSRDALREIRYSLDGCELDRRFAFEPWTDLVHLPLSAEDESIRVPKTVSSVCIQLVYLDGEVTEPRSFEHRRTL